MKTSIMLVSVLAVLAATPAAAGEFDTGDSYGPRGPVATQGIGFPAKANGCPTGGDVIPLACGVVPGTGWNPYGTVTSTAAELQAQQAVNTAWRRRQHESIREDAQQNGHWSNGWLPVEFGAASWGFMARGGVGGSQGGSD